MKQVLLVGSDGLLGSAIADCFVKDYKIIAFDKPELDITDRGAVINKVRELSPDIIINTAAYNGVDQAEQDNASYNLARMINSEAVGHLAEAAKISGATLVHFSSDYVFSGKNKNGYDERSLPSPISNYGRTKLEGEELLMKNTDRFYLIRLSRMFGPPGKSLAAKKSFVDQIIASAAGKDELRIIDEEFSCPTYSIDLSNFVINLFKNNAPFGIYHGANSGVTTWYRMTEEIFRLKAIKTKLIPIKSTEFKRLAKRPPYSELINTKFSLQRPWQEALAEYLK